MSLKGAAKGAAAAFVGYKILSKLNGGTRVPSKGRLVLITGAAQGIGRFMALQFAARGARLVLQVHWLRWRRRCRCRR